MTDTEKTTPTFEGEPPGTSPDGSLVQQTRQLERRVVRKLDWHLMSLFFALYMLAFLDRSNIGNAKIAGMAKDLSLDSYKFNWLLTIFYLAYVLAEPTVLLWKRYPPHLVGAFVVFSWGLVASVQAGTSNWSGMMALRFLLGVFEATYGPGIIFLLSFFYLRHEIGFRCGIFVSAAPLASTFAGALAYGITSGDAHIANWRLLFLVEGLPTVAMTVVTYFFLPDSPDKARFLKEEEKAVARSRIQRQVGTDAEARIGGLKFKEIGLVLVDAKAWVNSIMYFCGNVTFSSLSVFLPTILEDMGFTAIDAQGLSAPPSLLAFFASLVTTWIADRTQQRCLMVFGTSLTGCIGYVILATVDTVGVRYFATFLVSAGVFATIPNLVALTLNNQGSDTRRGTAVVLLQMVGQCGPFLGTNIYPSSQAPRYIKGMSICTAMMALLAVLAIVQRSLLAWENLKLDRQHGPVSKAMSDADSDKTAVENYGPDFRYVL